jgi:hypothetical protein
VLLPLPFPLLLPVPGFLISAPMFLFPSVFFPYCRLYSSVMLSSI